MPVKKTTTYERNHFLGGLMSIIESENVKVLNYILITPGTEMSFCWREQINLLFVFSYSFDVYIKNGCMLERWNEIPGKTILGVTWRVLRRVLFRLFRFCISGRTLLRRLFPLSWASRVAVLGVKCISFHQEGHGGKPYQREDWSDARVISLTSPSDLSTLACDRIFFFFSEGWSWGLEFGYGLL